MTGISYTLTIGSDGLREAIDRMIARGGDLTPAKQEIGERWKLAVDQGFEHGHQPGGLPWVPSIRALREGGQTLVDSGGLRDSVSYEVTDDGVELGSNKVYAGVHQRGATIVPKDSPFLQFKIGDRTVRAKKVRIPPRPFIGVGRRDMDAFGRILADYLAGVS